MTLEFFVRGTPIAQPRPRAQGRPGMAPRIYTKDNGVEEWKAAIRRKAFNYWNGVRLDGPLAVTLYFYIARPKGHLSAKHGLKPSAPAFHVQKPDVDNLAKAAIDALSDRKKNGITTHGIWTDDDNIVRLHVEKFWEPDPAEAGCWFQISILENHTDPTLTK